MKAKPIGRLPCDICLTSPKQLHSQQTLTIFEENGVDFEYIEQLFTNEVFDNQIEFAAR